jgi:arginyl-tRNA synthetase
MSQSASPDLKSGLEQWFRDALRDALPDTPTDTTTIVLERPRNAAHGDYACNVAMQLARALRRNPREIAQAVLAALPSSPLVARTELAGAGFINVYLSPAAKHAAVRHVLREAERYGRSAVGGGQPIQIEFVSANPTGPLHVGHGRGAAYGASLANLLDTVGWHVQREFYVNDAGRQMDILLVSVWMRYLEAGGVAVPFPPNGYQGDYVRTRADELRRAHGAALEHDAAAVLAGAPAPTGAETAEQLDALHEARMDVLIANMKTQLGDAFRSVLDHVLARQLDECRDVLARFGVTFDRWYSEQSLYTDGKVAATLDRLRAAGHLYEKDGATWFRSTAFGDDKDRVVQRDNGLYTYFASDIAYHDDKLRRGYVRIADVWGADHHGYIPRVKAAIAALGEDPDRLVVPLIQLVALTRAGQPVRMGKRSGNYVTLEELYEDVGVDAARFFYVSRKSDQHLEFDLDLAKAQSADNPVYYLQYAHARVARVLEQWGGDPATLADVDLAPLVDAAELQLVQRLIDYPESLIAAAREYAPHVVAIALREIAAEFHGWYNGTRILVPEEDFKLARLALARAAQQVLRNGLALLGVSAPERM